LRKQQFTISKEPQHHKGVTFAGTFTSYINILEIQMKRNGFHTGLNKSLNFSLPFGEVLLPMFTCQGQKKFLKTQRKACAVIVCDLF